MKLLDFRISAVSINTLVKVLEAVAGHPKRTTNDIVAFAGVGRSTGRRALAVLEALGLVQRDTDGKYICTEPAIRRGIDQDRARQFLRRALLTYRPFESVVEGLALGERFDDAVRKASVLLSIPAQDAGKFNILREWGVELALLQVDGKHVSIGAEIVPGARAVVGFITASDVESEARARLHVAKRLGREAYNALDRKDRDLLVDALLAISTDPSDAVEKAGQAIENYLREVCDANGLAAEASKLNGGSQLTSLLISKGLIHSHQQKIVECTSTLRNAKAHHKDKKTLTPWHIDEDGALASFFSTVTAIKSIHSFITAGKQLL